VENGKTGGLTSSRPSDVVPPSSQSAEADEDVNIQHHDGELKGQELGWRGA
jgi:hypothetical protein